MPLIIGGLFVFAVLLRLIPIALAPAGAGVDHWFWKAYVEEYRRSGTFPPSLPQYVLDEHQWYPPIFPLVLATLPTALFDKWDRGVAMAIDLLRMILLIGVAYWQSSGNTTVIVIAGLVYATTPILVSYNIQLNPRGLAALMLEAVLILLLLLFDLHAPAWLWLVVVVLSSFILLTHKMTTQLFWFMMLGTAVVYRRWEALVLIPASIATALLLSGGFYWKVLRAHWDIVAFWNRNWRWIGADPLRESPIYGDGSYERPEKLHRTGLRGFLWHLSVLFGFNPAAWIACLLVYERLWLSSPVLIFPTQLLVWLLLPCMFACLTTFVPSLKCFGAGYLYVYNTALQASLLLALAFQYTKIPHLSTPFVLLALALNVIALAIFYVQFYRNKRGRVHADLSVMLDKLRTLPLGVVMCLPMNWYEVVAYKTKMPVLWGAHGYGFKRIEPTFPRLLIPIGEVFDRYKVRYLLTMNGIIPPNVSAAFPPATVLTSNDYQLYCFDMAQLRGSERVETRAEPATEPPVLASQDILGKNWG
jgi:hypothetical protein